jgi:hypothetical protein
MHDPGLSASPFLLISPFLAGSNKYQERNMFPVLFFIFG